MSTRGRVAIYVVYWSEQRFSKNSGSARFLKKSEADELADSLRTIYARVRVERSMVSPEFRARVARDAKDIDL